MSIFKKYDIRGIYPSTITGDKVRKIGRTFAELRELEGEKVAVGRDGRNSSPFLAASLIKGLLEGGCEVVDIGLVATPMLYFEVVEEDLKGGIMVTASHNPKTHNGLRLCGENALDITYETGIEDIEDSYQENFEEKDGEMVQEEVEEDFVEKVSSDVDFSKDLKVVLDHGNGPSVLVGKEIFENIGCEVVEINKEIDGNFPGRGPDPSENPEQLIEKTKETDADLGIAFDGDADRGFFVDGEGNVVENDLILALFVKYFADSEDSVIFDIKCSQALEDVIEESGAEKILCQTGMSYVKRKMMEEEAKIGGEYSGHFFFRENDYYDDPFFATRKLLEVMDENDEKLSSLVEKLPQYYSSSELRPKCTNREEVIERIREDFSDRRIVDVDGAKIYFENGWALVRSSATEQKLSIRFEAETEKGLEEIKDRVMKKVEEYMEK